MFITIPTHIDEGYIEFINGKYPIKEWIYCNEMGDSEDGYEHSHLAITFQKKTDIRDCRALDYNDQHPKIEPCKKWPAAVKYCMKEGKYKANFDTSKFEGLSAKIDKIIEAKSDVDAIKDNATKMTDIMPIIAVRKLKGAYINYEYLAEIAQQELRPWQKEALNILQTKDDRYVHWLYEKKGNVGKTFFLKYVLATGITDTCIFSGAGTPQNLIHILRNFIEKHQREPSYCLMNLPRLCSEHLGIYTFIEMLKDGLITATKYNSDTFIIRPPVVIVMANWLPQTRNTLSLDRFIVKEIIGKTPDTMSLVPVTLGNEDMSDSESVFNE